MKHRYYTLRRPPMIGGIPKAGLLEVCSFDDRQMMKTMSCVRRTMVARMYCIRSDDGYWSNELGWVYQRCDATLFSSEEAEWILLPIGKNVRLVLHRDPIVAI